MCQNQASSILLRRPGCQPAACLPHRCRKRRPVVIAATRSLRLLEVPQHHIDYRRVYLSKTAEVTITMCSTVINFHGGYQNLGFLNTRRIHSLVRLQSVGPYS